MLSKAEESRGAGHPAIRHLVAIDDVPDAVLENLFATAEDMAATLRIPTRLSSHTGRIIALLFFEPSSRTILSFRAASARLGAGVIAHQGAGSSSLSKGESIEDTIRVVGGYADLIILRHEESGVATRAARVSTVPLINAGDGGNEHPTQALIDMFTIRKEYGRLHSLSVGMGFDPQHSRSIHSLCRGLSRYANNSVMLIGPRELWWDAAQLDLLRGRGLQVDQTEDLDALFECEIAYVNRFQAERISDLGLALEYRDRYRVRYGALAKSKIELLLDPLPRVHEIEEEVDELPQAAYFRQAANAVPVRMALLALMV